MDPQVRQNLGDAIVVDDADAAEWQTTLEKALKKKLNFKLHRGDLILTQFNHIPREQNSAKKNHSVGHSYVSRRCIHVVRCIFGLILNQASGDENVRLT